MHNGVITISELSKKKTVKILKPLLIVLNITKDHRMKELSDFFALETDFMPKPYGKVSGVGLKKRPKNQQFMKQNFFA